MGVCDIGVTLVDADYGDLSLEAEVYWGCVTLVDAEHGDLSLEAEV